MDEGRPDPYGMMGDHPCPDVGEYAHALEVTSLPAEEERSCRDALNLARFRELAGQLEGVQPGKLGEEEKVAFWINLYNALLMHVRDPPPPLPPAFLVAHTAGSLPSLLSVPGVPF